jgi:hypothetical protein
VRDRIRPEGILAERVALESPLAESNELGFLWILRRRGRGHDCRKVRDNASAYLEGEARAPLAERIRLHLAACRNCDGFVGTLRATVAAPRNLPVEKPPDATLDRVRRIARP